MQDSLVEELPTNVLKRKKGQGASEYLILLGAVLLIGLVVIALLGYYPGTSNDISKSQTSLYWSTAKPLAVREAHGGTRQCMYDTALLVVKNLGSDRLIIKGVSINGGYGNGQISYGNDVSQLDSHNHIRAGPGLCLDNQANNCTISVNPGQQIYLQADDNGVCGTGQSGNSIVQSAQAKLAIYYESYGLTQTETSDIKINLDCWGYFLCKSNSDCSVYEGGEGSPTCNQANGACENLCTPG